VAKKVFEQIFHRYLKINEAGINLHIILISSYLRKISYYRW